MYQMMKSFYYKILSKGLTLLLVCVMALTGCGNKAKDASYWDDLGSPEFWRRINTVDAHNEQDTIIGNFTGNGQDSLFVVCDTTKEEADGCFYIQSNNKEIPRLNLIGIYNAPPKLVNEGDLDDNGTCEVGYLPTWNNSQWRSYCIFTLVNYQWRYLVNGEYLDTPEWFRHSGVEIAEKGPHKGQVLIHYAYEGPNESQTMRITEIRDTIVNPTYSEIDD